METGHDLQRDPSALHLHLRPRDGRFHGSQTLKGGGRFCPPTPLIRASPSRPWLDPCTSCSLHPDGSRRRSSRIAAPLPQCRLPVWPACNCCPAVGGWAEPCPRFSLQGHPETGHSPAALRGIRCSLSCPAPGARPVALPPCPSRLRFVRRFPDS